MPINNLIQFRKGNSSDWLINPVLQSGEPGFDVTNNILKIGDGVSTWNNLEPVNTKLNNFNIYGTGNINISGNITANSGNFDVISFNINNESILTKGQISWDDTEGTMDIGLTDNTTIHIGEHRYFRIRNETGGVLYKGQVVYATGVHSNGLITPSKYVADGSVREVRFMGAVLEDVNNQNNGYVVDFGHLQDMDLDGSASDYAVGDETWVAGDILYVHPTVAGKLTKVEPKHSISVAIVLDPGNGNGNGRMFVRPTSYGHLDDNHDVAVSGATNGQFLQYNSATDYWVPSSSGNFSTLLVNGTGVSLIGHTHVSADITDFNSSVSGLLPVKDIVAGTGISVAHNEAEGIITVGLAAATITGYEILTTTKDTFTVTPNYLIGNLQVYYNGFKLLDGEDYTATDGTSFVLDSAGGPGDVVEWVGLGGPPQYSQLNHTHTISDITNFGSGVSGLLPTVANSGDNRILTSTGSSVGIVAESNFTFDGTSLSHHAGNFANAGDAQHTILVVRRTTTDSTADVVLTLDGNTPGASNRPTIPAQSVWTFSLKLSAYNDTDNLGAWWIFRGGIRRNAANETVLVGSLVVENDSEGAMSGASATVVADDTNEALEIRVTGLSSKNIRWVGVLDISQVSYGTP